MHLLLFLHPESKTNIKCYRSSFKVLIAEEGNIERIIYFLNVGLLKILMSPEILYILAKDRVKVINSATVKIHLKIRQKCQY